MERARHSNRFGLLKGSSSTKHGILAILGVGKPKTRKGAGLGSVVLMAAAIRRKYELFTYLSKDDEI